MQETKSRYVYCHLLLAKADTWHNSFVTISVKTLQRIDCRRGAVGSNRKLARCLPSDKQQGVAETRLVPAWAKNFGVKCETMRPAPSWRFCIRIGQVQRELWGPSWWGGEAEDFRDEI